MRHEHGHNGINWRIGALIAVLIVICALILVGGSWELQPLSDGPYWNGVIAFLLTAFVCDAWSLRISFANISSSVGFLPFFASVMLFRHPVPMLIAGATAFGAEVFVRHKPKERVLFNIAQYMVATGGSAAVYSALGGAISVTSFSFSFVPFAGMVLAFFVVNQGSVALAVAMSNRITLRESWERVSGSRLNDVLASSLAVLLVFLYVKLQFVGLLVILFPLFLVRQLYEKNLQLQDEMEEKLELMVKAIEARDPYTSGHSRRVAGYVTALARDLNLAPREIDAFRRAALLHDVGKIYEEFAPLLRKTDKLTPDERLVMQSHVVRSAELVATVSRLRGTVLEVIRHHHENFDGSGYPDGLEGERIPLGARLIMIADTIDAMTTDRPYRRALSFDRAIDELTNHAGRQFDPALVSVATASRELRRLLVGGPELSASHQPVDTGDRVSIPPTRIRVAAEYAGSVPGHK